ncbi:MAG: prolyl oligopeptidase family serine peptidase [Candidatus Sericytochromatia bacterium]
MYISNNIKKAILLSFSSLFIQLPVFSQNTTQEPINNIPYKYMMPPKEIMSIVDAPLSPVVNIAPNGDYMLLMERPSLPSINEFSAPELKLAGIRINPLTHGGSRILSYSNLKFKRVSTDKPLKINGLPSKARINYVTWSPDSRKVAFTNTKENGIELWVVDIYKKQANLISKMNLNATFGKPFQWLSNSKSLICTVVPGDIGKEPEKPKFSSSPIVQESFGKQAASRTYPDLLTNNYDEKLFEYYFSSKLVKLNLDGKVERLTNKLLISGFEASPDGNYVLVQSIHRPFSYVVPYYRFPEKSDILNMSGKIVKELEDSPLAEEVPISFDSVPTGKRNISWRNDKGSVLYWVEAQDKGDPKTSSKIRDIVYTLPSPFKDKPKQLIQLSNRFDDIMWGDSKLAIVKEKWWKTRNEKTWILPPDYPQFQPKMIFDRSSEDRYSDPGSPITTMNKYGSQVLLTGQDNSVYMSGLGASPEGDKPFLDKFNLRTLKSERLWRSSPPYLENLVKIIDEKNLRLITKIESTNKQPNYYVRNLSKNMMSQITDFPHPTPQLADVKKEIITYKREDGVSLNATLYLPPNYEPKSGKKLPMLMWAYPREFKNADAAGQIQGSPYEFIRIGWGSPLFWLTQGYAILEGPAMPIIGEGDKEPNDTYVKQLVSSAKAAVDEVIKRGITEKDKIAIGGHSYGAFMTANLLAHSDLFKTGIARSGAYNRTLTPFGFQSEERTLWQVPEIYSQMSPFNNANKINEPILLIHGANDENPGTFPMQSERMYSAIKGLGGKVRLVMLPYEGHHYQARESVMHMLWEMNEWLNRNLKDNITKTDNIKTPKKNPKPKFKNK